MLTVALKNNSIFLPFIVKGFLNNEFQEGEKSCQ